MTYDPIKLAQLGAERIALLKRLDEIKVELDPEVIGALADGVTQTKITELTGYNRDSQRLISMTPEQREAEREKKRQRTRKG